MADAGIGNPAGAVQIDGFEPKVWSFTARGNISGGGLVFASGATGVVSSGTNSVITSDFLVAPTASGLNFTGVALKSAASGSVVPVALEGVFLLVANGTVTAGQTVLCDGNNSVATGTTAGTVIGRALTAGASGGYCAVYIRG